MMRSLFSAISGLRNHQTFMDVVGNNIANVNTTGFKQSRVTFQDILSQTIRGASSPQGGRAGTNPEQVGLGVQIGSIDTLQTQGTLQATGKPTDMAIQGDGFFVLSDSVQNQYTRDGSFDLGIDGTLVSPATGLRVMGWQADASGKVDTSRPVGSITLPIGQGMQGEVSSSVIATGNLNQAIDYTSWAPTNASGGALTITGTPQTTPVPPYRITINTTDATTGEVKTFTWEKWDSTTDAWVVGGTAVAGNSFQDNDVTFSIGTAAANKAGDIYYTSAQESAVSVYDSLGGAHSVRTIFSQQPASTNPRSWQWYAFAPDAAGTPVSVGTGALTFDTSGHSSSGGSGTLTLSSLPTGNGALANGAADMTLTYDLTGITQLGGPGAVTQTTDGAAAGTLSMFTVGQAGDIIGVFTNGKRLTLGQIAVASFANASGLVKEGGNLFQSSANSGDAQIGVANAAGRGAISTGFLEMSNVDLAQQFTNMIMAERGFQANSRVITTSDEILQDLVNLKR